MIIGVVLPKIRGPQRGVTIVAIEESLPEGLRGEIRGEEERG